MKRLLVVVLLLVACGGPAADTAAPSGDVSAAPPAERTEAAGASGSGAVPAALDWSVDRIGGGQIEGGDLAGRDVVLWFWAPW